MGERVIGPFLRLWMSTRPGFGVSVSRATEERARRGFWDGDEFALFGGSASVGVSFSGGMHCADRRAEPSVSIVAFFGVHEDAREVEWADLSPKQARRLARALNRAARLAEVASEEANAALKDQPHD